MNTRNGTVRWISAGAGVLVVVASVGSFAHIRDAMCLFGQAGAFAWLAAGVIEFGGILGILLLSQSTRVAGARPAGIAVVGACQGISLWANQAMVTASYASGQSVVSARVAGCVFPSMVVLGLIIEIVLARHGESLAAAAAAKAAAAEAVEREAQRRREDQARKDAARVEAERRAAQEAREQAARAMTPPVAERPVPRPAPRPVRAATVKAQRAGVPDLDEAVAAAIDAGADPRVHGWYTALMAGHGGSRTWWKDRVGPRVLGSIQSTEQASQIRRIG